MNVPLPREVPAARLCSPRYATDPLRPQPISGHLSSQSNSSSMSGASSDHPHPLRESAMVVKVFQSAWIHTDVQLVPGTYRQHYP